jgi:hypothetical protein
MVAPGINTLDLLLDPLAECLTPEVADRIGRLELSAAIRGRLEDYAARSGAGTLDAQAQAEYRDLVELIDLIGIVQAKARHVAATRER